MEAQWLAAWSAAGMLILAILARWPGRFFWRLIRRTWQFLEDWNGEPARPGVKARPGVMQRLDSHDRTLAAVAQIVGYQLAPNDGTSMYDKLTRIDAVTAQPQAAPSIHIHTDGRDTQ